MILRKISKFVSFPKIMGTLENKFKQCFPFTFQAFGNPTLLQDEFIQNEIRWATYVLFSMEFYVVFIIEHQEVF